ncbi:MAG TPA: bifunctional 4-hydroxy-2-oxoglutarate aldolase/2-dehydro-3-deoxy-phosphogluconate aldolase [Propionicimonas sp.]|nr:bifunctional 4-hydroxy-2-oxoglutarate aldolase/2-dehydro-3-deoxy-phosphogluconate aldolase [Propionicimonas sp.]HRA07084.1 bifunctional 4-hydroxy-2-oxoglutarate aldolase/2-dehydro-3-deoxy-phosphogluconate aldolase [Propionicimonas sp.]
MTQEPWSGRGPIIPVLVIDDAAIAVDLARALVAGGLTALEVTLRTPAAPAAIAAIAAQVPEATVGAGTLRLPSDAGLARDAGATFAVTPGYTRELGAACRAAGLPLLPGVATASELLLAFADGYRFCKFFPAVAAGGVPVLKALAGPFPDVSFCPTGGITEASAPEFLALASVPVCGGTWLTPAELVTARDWTGITELARRAAALGREGTSCS